MAAIDKIYGTQAQFDELKNWLKDNKPGYLKYLYADDGYIREQRPRPIANFPYSADIWLYANCPLQFVLDSIITQYGKDEWQLTV